MTERIEAVRAGFWRRAGALLVDAIIVVVLLELATVIAFQMSNGRVQLAEDGFRALDCTTLAAPPPDVPALSFKPNETRRCRATIFGWPIAHTLIVSDKAKDGSVDSETRFAVDKSGRLIPGIFLDFLWLPLLIGLRLWRDRADASPGRQAVNTHIAITSTGADRASALNKRDALFALPWLPVVLFELWSVVFGTIETTDRDLDITKSLNSIAAIVLLVVAVIPIIRKRDAFYDRWAGTAVVRDRQPKG